jgi:dienelactone hydrolase
MVAKNPTTLTAAVVILLAALIGLAACNQTAQEAGPTQAERVQEAVMAYLSDEAHKITERAVAETASREAWEPVRRQRLAELKDMLGLAYDRPKTPLNVQLRGTIERPGYVVERISFESLPKVYVTANLYLPTDRDGPVPAVIYVCGHAFSPFGAKTSYQRHGHTLARHGYAAMVIDPIQIAETAGLHHGVFNQEMYEWYTRAYSPAGLEVWNVIRALDYLETRPEIDSQRFAITGRSGGAAMSWFSAAVEPRIKAVVPIMGIGTYAVSVPDDTQRRHCDCMYPVNFRMHDLIHLGALIAPRPLFTAHGRLDPLFPVAGYEQFEAAMAKLYSSYGVPDQFRNLVVESGHEDSDVLRAESVHWLDRWLLEREPREIDVAFQEVEATDLAVFGGDAPKDARNYRAHEFFIPPSEPVNWTSLAAWETKRDELVKALREDILHTILDDPPVATIGLGNLAPPNGYEAISFDYAGRIPVEAMLRIPENPQGPALLYVAAPGEDPAAVSSLLRNLRRFGRNPVLVVYPPGTGTDVWPKSSWTALLRNAMQTGRTVDTIRIGSVLAGVQLLRGRAGQDRSVAISGVGPAAGWALYAAALDESIAQAILIRAPSSHIDGPILLGAMRHVDLPDIAALVAPRHLTFYGQMPAAFGRTRQIYKGLGAGEHISVSMSLGAALNRRFGHDFSIGL